jgi:hypothetical protein
VLLRICLICSLLVLGAMAVVSQSSSQRVPRKTTARPDTQAQPTPPATPAPEPSPEPTLAPAEEQEAETVKTDTNLITVPVIATTNEGNYVPDLRQEEFNISEDGAPQEVAFFATVSAPFHVVLLLDTSASTQDKLKSIQKAAVAFVEQLQRADEVKVISFDNELRDLSEFTNDRAALKNAIYKTVSGQGTRLYDAMELAINSIRTIKGRKAIVLFSDGVDFHSDQSTFDSTIRWLDEQDVIVYPIRFETRAQTEQIVREAEGDTGPQLPTIDVIRTPAPGTTPPTFPGSDDPSSVPTSGQKRTGPLGLPTAAEIMRGQRRQRDPDADRYPSPGGQPPVGGPTSGPTGPTSQPNGRSDPRDPLPDPNDPNGRTYPSGRNKPRRGDSVDVMLDQLYLTADLYLAQLANKTGGRMLRADTLESLPEAFAKIAAELRTQYAVGYYSTNKMRNGEYRKIKVKSTRKSVVLRARPGYRAPSS